MSDLVTWLRAQLDEDERVALAVNADDWREATEPGNFNEWNSTEIDHVRLHAPARVLAEVEAKRRILDWLGSAQDRAINCDYFGLDEDQALRLLALPYADQPGYLEEWRPDQPA